MHLDITILLRVPPLEEKLNEQFCLQNAISLAYEVLYNNFSKMIITVIQTHVSNLIIFQDKMVHSLIPLDCSYRLDPNTICTI